MAAPALDTQLLEALKRELPPQLPAYLMEQRWFGGKARQVLSAAIADIVPLHSDGMEAIMLLAQVEYSDEPADTYALPFVCFEESGAPVERDSSVLKVHNRAQNTIMILKGALTDEKFLPVFLHAILREQVFQGLQGEIRAARALKIQLHHAGSGITLRPKLLQGEQSNSSVIYGERFILKLFRRVEEGVNPDWEIGLFLTERVHFAHVPPVEGSWEYRGRDGRQMTLAILQGFVPNEGDAWRYTLRCLDSFYEKVGQLLGEATASLPAVDIRSDFPSEKELSRAASELAGPYLESAALLGRRTAELHLSLASDSADPVFAPEPYTEAFQRASEQGLRELTQRVYRLLRRKINTLEDDARARAEELACREEEILQRFHASLSRPIQAMRTRIHGDYHLGQVLYTGSDFVIIDFEGEPARSLAERRAKRSPLQDVAGMLRSFHYAAFAPLLAPVGASAASMQSLKDLAPWAERWSECVTSRFLRAYLETAGSALFVPPDPTDFAALLEVHLLEKAVYELGYELNNRPKWVGIPLAGISALLASHR